MAPPTTKLEGVKRLSRESGVDFIGPTTTLNQTGKFLQLVEWYDAAYDAIQSIHPTWKFLHKEFTAPLVIDQALYTPAELGVSDLGNWKPNDWRFYITGPDEIQMAYEEYEVFRLAYQVGSQRTDKARQIRAFTTKPDDNVLLYPIPSEGGTINGEYYRSHHRMTDDGHTPIFSNDYHMIIVWRALMYYGIDMQEQDKYQHGKIEFQKLLRHMEKRYLPRILWGRPLV